MTNLLNNSICFRALLQPVSKSVGEVEKCTDHGLVVYSDVNGIVRCFTYFSHYLWMLLLTNSYWRTTYTDKLESISCHGHDHLIQIFSGFRSGYFAAKFIRQLQDPLSNDRECTTRSWYQLGHGLNVQNIEHNCMATHHICSDHWSCFRCKALQMMEHL